MTRDLLGSWTRSNWPQRSPWTFVTFWGQKLGKTDHKGHRDLRGNKVGHWTLMTLWPFGVINYVMCPFFLSLPDAVSRPFCFCSVFSFFYYSFLFFSTATCVPRFLHYFSTDLDEIWHVDSPWWDEQTEYFFKSVGPGVGIGRGPKVYYAL